MLEGGNWGTAGGKYCSREGKFRDVCKEFGFMDICVGEGDFHWGGRCVLGGEILSVEHLC